MNRITVSIYIPADEYLRVYQGSAKHVSTISHDGRSVRFPASILQRFVTRDGIRGTFGINFDQEGKFQSVTKLD